MTNGAAGIGRLQAVLGPVVERCQPAAFRFLRCYLPVVATSRFALVVRDADVRFVLGSRADFSVERYTHKIMEVAGPFPLAFDDTEHYDPTRAVIAAAIVRGDADSLASRARTIATGARAALGRSRFDVVGDFLDPVIAQLACEYLGITGIEAPLLFHWARTVFTEIFVSSTPFVRPRAVDVVTAFRSHLDGVVARRRAIGGDGSDAGDVLGRLLAARVPDATVSGTLLGLVVAWMPSASKMLALAIDELLDRPDPLAWADDAARRGDEDELAAILFEAVRFRPPAPGIFRTATRPVRVGIDSRRPKTLRAGCAVLAATMSAMMDPDALEAPDEFRLDRPWTDYLHFGYGLHTCAGEALNRASLPAVLAGLLRHGALARAPGPAGHLRWRYPYPSRLEVTVRARRAP